MGVSITLLGPNRSLRYRQKNQANSSTTGKTRNNPFVTLYAPVVLLVIAACSPFKKTDRCIGLPLHPG